MGMKERAYLCKELGLYFEGMESHGDVQIAMDRLVQARAALRAFLKYFNGDHEMNVMTLVEDGSTMEEVRELARIAMK